MPTEHDLNALKSFAGKREAENEELLTQIRERDEVIMNLYLELNHYRPMFLAFHTNLREKFLGAIRYKIVIWMLGGLTSALTLKDVKEK